MAELTQAYLKSIIHYSPDTGVFTWRVTLGNRGIKNSQAGTVKTCDGKPYRQIKINKKLYYAHRLAWLYMRGTWPSNDIDHWNLNGLDNSWSNLRLATQQQNAMNTAKRKNNTSGHKGVCRLGKKWQAAIMINGKNYYLGYFDSKEDAAQAYELKAKELYGEFARV